MRRQRRDGVTIALSLSLAVLLIIAASFMLWCSNIEQAANPSPSPLASADKVADAAGDEFAEVDWNYWSSINGDIIGWVNVPGTQINHPIAQAPPDNPTFYLEHDAYGQFNPMGCPYLDAGCESLGLDSINSVVSGHHWSKGRVFSDFARFSDAGYAARHSRICVQTPRWMRTYEVQGVDVIKGTEKSKRTEFVNREDFESWYSQRLGSCEVLLLGKVEDEVPESIATFCTCSYGRWANDERTIIYAIPIETFPSRTFFEGR